MQDAGLSLLVAASPTFIAKATPSAPSRSAQLRTMSELLDHGDRALRKAFLESVDGIRDSITLTHITKFLENGDTEGALRYLDRVVPGFFEKVNEARDDLFIKAGKKVASDLREKSPIILTRFDQSNVRAVEMMAQNRGQFIREVTESQRNSVYQAMSRGIRDGKNPREVARDFRDAIGLTPRQELAVANYRRGLESNDLSVSLNRALRDHRFDSTVRQAARDSKPLPAPQVDKMVGRYRDRYVKYRAEVVARTEGLRSVNEGAQELWEQVAEGESIIAENEIRRRWSISKDHRVRLWHRLIPALNPDGVRIKEPFRTPKGPLMYPGDPSGTADNTIQCRCVLTFDINLEEDTDDIIVGDFEGVELPDAPPAHATPKKPRKKRTRASAARLPSFPATQSTPDAFDYDADEIDLSKLSGAFAEEKAAWIKQHKAGGSVSEKYIEYWERFERVATHLRSGKDISGENLTGLVVDKVRIKAQPALLEDVKVFRGMDFDDAGLLAIRNQLDSGEFIEKSFMSTTYQKHFGAQWGDNFGRRNVIFEIDVPKGSKGVITGGKGTEYEMTFAPNAKFEVIKIKDMKMLRRGAKDGNATVVKLRYLGIDDPTPTPADLRRVAAAKAATKHLLENEGAEISELRRLGNTDYDRTIQWKDGEVIQDTRQGLYRSTYSGEQMLFEILKTFDTDDLEKFVPGYKYRLDTAPTHTHRIFHEGLESVDPDFVPTANIKGDDLSNVKNIFHTNGDETLKQLKRGLFDENGHPKNLEITRRRRAEGDKFPAFYRGAKDDSFDEIEMDDIVTSNSQNSRYVAAMRHEFGHYVDRSRVEGKGDGWRGDKEVYEPLEAARAKYAKNRPTDMAGNNSSDVVFAYRSSAYVDEIYDDRADWSIGKKDKAEYEDEFGRRGFHTAGDDETARIANLVKTLDDDLEAAGHKRILKDLVDGSGISEVNLADLKTEDRYDLITSLFRFRDAMVDKNASQLNEAMREFHFVVKSALPDTADNTFHQVHTQFADFFGSMTNNKVGWGHQTEYLKTRTPLKQVFGQDAVGGAISDINTTEMFANYFANRVGSTTANRAYLTMMRHFAPKTAKGFDDIIETRAKKMAGDSYTRPASTIPDADKVGDLFAPATPKPRKKRRKKRRSKKKPDLDAAIARPKREYLKEFPEDMDAEDIESAQRLDLRKVFDDMFAESGISIEEFIMRTLGVNSLGGDDLYMTVRTNDGIIKIRGEQGKNIHKIQRDFLPGGEGVIHDLLHLLPGAQGKGIAKKLMREEIDLYEDLGIKQVNLQANIEGGAYAWARYGFVPTNYGWNGLRSRLRKKLQILYEESTIVTDDVVKRLSTLLSSPDPKVLWKVADFMVGDKKIGKRLLFGDSWHGTLDLNDKESMARFNSYVNPDRDLEAPTQGPVRTDADLDAKIKDLDDNPPPESKISDNKLKEFARYRWGDQAHELLDGVEFDKIEGAVLFRGVTQEAFLESNIDGSFVGRGIFGNGNYYARGDIKESFPNGNPLSGGWMIRSKLRADAKVITFDDLQQRGLALGGSRFADDYGRMAAKLGYDAIRIVNAIDDADDMVILNQSKMVVDKRWLPDGKIGKKIKAKATESKDFKELFGFVDDLATNDKVDLDAPGTGPVKEKDFFFEETDITFSDRDEHWQKKFERLQTLTNSKVALHHGGFDYTISGPIMRGQKVPKGMSKKEVTRIKSQILADKKQIAAAPAIPFDSKVYRFAGFEGAGKKLIEQQLADGMISDPGFTSTSVKPEFVLLWARQSPTPKGSRYYFEIDVPKGSKGARLQSQFEVDEDDIFQEIELTFAANAKFQVLKVIRPEQSGENGTLVKLRYLSEEKPAHAARPAATTGSVDRNQIRVKFNDYAYDASITTKDINYIRGVINSGDGDAIRELLDYKMEVDGARLGSVLDIDNIDLDAPSIGPVRDITPDTYNYENDILDLKSLEGFEDKEWKSWQRHYKSFGSPDDSHLNFWGPVKYGDMSRFLRGRLSKHPIPDGIAGKIDADRMKIMTTRAVVEDVKVYRGISVGDSQATNFLDRLKTGEFVEKSFMSTSAGRSAATAFLDSDDTGGNFLFEIDVPKGSKGVTAGGNYKKDELEMTFAPNARLEVIKIKENVKMQGGHFSHEGKSVTIVKLRYMGIDETVVKPKPKPKSAAVEEFKQSKDWVRHSEELRERQLKADSTTLDWLKRAYTYMGPYLRGSTIPSFYNRTSTLLPSSISDIQQRVRKDIARIDKAPALGHDMVTYRYVAFDNDTFLKSQLKSGIFRDPAFLSTALKREYIFDWASRAKNQAKHQYMFEIDVPKGSKGVRLASPGSKDGGVAVELTFKPNAEFEILRTSKTTINGKPGTLVKMRYIDDSKVKQPKVVTPKTEPVVEPPQAPKPKKPAQPARMAQKPNERPALLPARALTAEEQIKYEALLVKYEEKLDKERALGDLKVLDGNDELFTRSMSNDRAINVLKELRLMMKIELGRDAEPKSPNWKKYGGAETMDEMKARHARQLKRGENSADYYEGLQRKYAAEIGGDDLEAPTTGPKREYLKDIPEDVEFTTNEEGINKYDTLFSDSDIGHEEFVLRTLGQNSLRGDGVGMEIKMDDMSDALVVQGGDDVIQTIQRKFGTDGWVEHSIFEIDSEFRGQGIAKKLMREAVDLYVDMDIKGITLQANITHGAYAWARYGFVPTPDEWDYVKGLVRHKFEEYQIGDKAISADDAARLQAILGSDDSKAIWQLADFEAGGEKIGKELLLDDYNVPDETDFDNLQGAYAQRDEIHARMKDKEYEDQDLEGMLDEVESNIEDYKQEYLDNSTAGYLKWNGEFDLHDKESMARFRSYVKPDRDLEAPSTGPKREYLKKMPKDVKFVANKEALGVYNFVFSKEVFPAGNDIGYEEFVMRALGVNSLGGKGIKAELNWNVNDVLQLDATGGNFRKLNREFSPDGTVTHLWLSLNDSAQNRGTSKKLMKEAVDLYEEVGFRKIILEANISHGAYAWARYGFVPNQDDWDSLRYKVLEKLENFGISDAGRKNLFRILNKADPKAIWKLADFEVGGEKIGKELLMDRYGGGDADKKLQVQLSRKSELEFKISGVGATDSDRDKWEELLREVTHDIGNLTRGDDGGRHLSWEGALDLRDKEAMARFHSYVEPKPEGGDAPAVRPAATTGSVDRNQIRVKFNDYAYDASITTKDINYIRGVINDGGDLDALLDYKLEFDGARLGTVLDIDSIDLEAPTTGPKREYLKEFPEDVNAEDVDTRPEFIKTFDEVFPDNDIGHEEFVMRVLGVNSLGGDKMVIRAGAFDGTINVSGGGDDIRRIHRTFWPDGIVDHRNLQLHPDAQGKGIAKKLMREAMDLYADMGIKRVDLLANIDTGAYAWARYGFVPRERVWFRLRDIINAKFVKWQRVAISEHTPISSDDVARLNKILHSTDPKAIWQLADFEAGGEKIGKELMMGETWPGSLDLNDKESMARFHAYVNPDRDLEAPTIGPVRDTPDAFDYEADSFDANAFNSVAARALHQKLVEDRVTRGVGNIKLWDFEGYDEKGAYLRGRNKNLRAQALAEIAADKTRIMNEPPISQDLKVFRGVNLDVEGEKNVLGQLQEGEFVERSFMSTSFSQKDAALWEYAPNSRWSDVARHIVFEIDVPKGSKGTIVGGIEEPELTFAPNARFEVIKIKDVKQTGLTNFQGDPIPGGNTTLVKLRYVGIDESVVTPKVKPDADLDAPDAGPKREYLKDPDDADGDVRFRTTEEGGWKYDDLFSDSDIGPEEFAMRAFGVNSNSADGMNIEIADENDALVVRGFNDKIQAIERHFYSDGWVKHGHFELDSQFTGLGLGKTIMKEAVDLYEDMGIKGITLSANITHGAYAWARYGFVPEVEDWEGLVEQVIRKFREYQFERDKAIPTDDAARLKKILASRDPKAIWKLADFTAGEEKIGKELLLDTYRGSKLEWHGALDFNDKESMARFHAYVNPDRDLDAPTAAPVRVEPTEKEVAEKIAHLDRVWLDMDRSAYEDTLLKTLAEYRWGKQNMTVLKAGGEFDDYDGQVTLFRGLSDIDRLDNEVENGWTGEGMFGNGTYYSSDPFMALQYSGLQSGGRGYAFPAKLSKEAKVIDYDELGKLHQEYKTATHRSGKAASHILRDEGRYAVSLGYHAIKVKQEVHDTASEGSFFVILDQSKLVTDRDWVAPDAWKRLWLSGIDDPAKKYSKFEDELLEIAAKNGDDELQAPSTGPVRDTHPEPTDAEIDAKIEAIDRDIDSLWEKNDLKLEEFARYRWGNQAHELLDGGEFDKIDASVIYRGVADIRYLDSNIDGSFFGKGVSGNGNYYSSDSETSATYANLGGGYDDPDSASGWLWRSKLRSDAKVILEKDLWEKWKGGRKKYKIEDFNVDMGRYAARLGYDAIKIGFSDSVANFVILNQSKVVVDKRWLPDGEVGRQIKEKIKENPGHNRAIINFVNRLAAPSDLEAPTTGPVREGWAAVRMVGIAEAKEMLIDEPLKELLLAAIKHPKNPFSDPSKDIVTGKMLEAMTAEEGSELTTDKTKVIYKGDEFIVYQIDEKFE